MLVYTHKHGQCPANSARIRYFLSTVIFFKNNTESFFDASISTGFVFSGYRLGYFV